MRCRLGAHRGWTGAGPENSLAALTAAPGVADFAELDVRLSADGVAVLAHEPEVGGHAVHEATGADLRAAGIATLAEVVRRLDSFPLDMEVKPDVDPTVLDEVCGLARPFDWITSFNWTHADEARARRPDVATGLLVDADWDLADAIDAARDAGHPLVAPHHSLVEGPTEGVMLAVWTVDDPADARRLVDYGVAAVISDRPDLLREVCT